MQKSERPIRQEMPLLDLTARKTTFGEVARGYSREQAITEAKRCLQCKKPRCVTGCPVAIDIPRFIRLIAEEKFLEAYAVIRETNALPAVSGRVCPQENQCEGVCILGAKSEPIAIGRLERFVADYAAAVGTKDFKVQRAPATGKKVAVVGAGPAGLTCAGELAKAGHTVTVFEALHKPGGVLVYGIPEFRLPKKIVAAEIDQLRTMGVEIKCNYVIGLTASVDELIAQGFDAVFIGTGAGLPKFLDIPGENLCGVFSANEYLTRVNLMKAYDRESSATPIHIGKHVVVLGAGNTAMDSARTAMRLGAESVKVVYRRTRDEVPARGEEVEHAMEEGIEFSFLRAPVRILGDERGWVSSMDCQVMELGEADASGRRRPVPVEGKEETLPCDLIINAVGSGSNKLLFRTAPDINLTKWGNIITTEETSATSKKGVFAGGDIVTGAATVILAMGAGRNAAVAMNEYLKTV
ncbi:TPA: glutamate synthase (NADPH), homotetrameric [Candidatus Sumerlaeota bacterium]|nr:glutamate synthase (NADPH), homotetrameric [Candidatus Sumerlaeota bacterium]